MEPFKKGEQVGGVTATVDATMLALMSATLGASVGGVEKVVDGRE